MAGPSRARLRTAFRSHFVAAARRLFFEPLEDRRPLAAAPLSALVISGPEPPFLPGAETAVVNGLLASSSLVFGEGEGEGSSSAGPAGPLLFAGIADHHSDPINAGMLTVIDPQSKSLIPWNSALAGGGLSGLAFDSTNRLFATIDRLPCSGSDLVELDPQTGAELRRVPVMAGSTPLSIGDLAIEPGTNRLLAIRSAHDDMNQAGQLYVIDPETGAATLLGDTGTRSGTSLAFTADGTLYSSGVVGGKPVLYKIDPTTAEPHARDPLTAEAIPWKQINDATGRLKEISGLVGDPTSNTLWASASSTRFAANQTVVDLYQIDPATGIAASAPLGAPARGILGDLAFQPIPRSLDVVYQEDFEDGPGGFTPDNSGGTIPGLWHYSPGRRFDGLPSHTPTNSWYYGAFETAFGEGNYVLPYDHEGTLTSPPILIPTSSVLSFNYLLDVRDELIVDFASVFVITADGTATRILSRAEGTLEKTGTNRWATAAASLAAFACQPIQIQFRFDTGPPPQIDPEGWYIDDVMIASTGGLCDFGDAPDGLASLIYPTLLANNGARHGALPNFFLGTRIDEEADGQPTLQADGDDHDANGDDEDGVTFIPLDPARTDPVLFAGQPGLANVQLTNPSSTAAFLDAWIDFNRDGDWLDDGEQVAVSSPLQPGANSVAFLVPAGVATGEAFARFRLSSTGGLDPTGLAQDGEVEDYLVTIEPWQPQVQVEKTGEWNDRDDNGRLDTTDTIDYTFTVTNTGNVSLLNVTLSDPGVDLDPPQGLIDIDGDGEADDLAVGQVAIWTGSAPLTAADIAARQKENTVIVEADAPNDDPIQDDDTTVVLLPSIALEKTNTSPGGWDDANENGRPDVGETIRYLFTITNDGKLPLRDVELSDSIATVSAISGLTDIDGDGADDLAVGGAPATATGQYVLTQADIDAAQRANTATVVAFDPAGNAIRGEDTNVTLLPTAAVELLKEGTWIDANANGRPDVGDTISYSFQVTNTGNVTLFNIAISDPMVTINALNGLTDEDADGAADDLRPGEIATAQGSYALTQADVDLRQKENTATVNAQTPGGNPLEDEASATVLLPSVALEKTNTSEGGWNDADGNGRPDVGETIDYLFTVTNDGKLPLLDLILTDSIADVSDLSGLTDEDDDGVADDLAPGQTATASGQYTLTQSDLDAEARSNTATIAAVDPDDNSLRDEDSITTSLPGAPSIEIIKTGTWNDINGNGQIDVGDSVAYNFEVTNTGNQTLTNIEVTDPLPGIGLIDPAPLELLLPGTSATFTATYFVQQSDLDDPDCAIHNTATVTADDPQGGEVSSTGDHAFPILGAAIRGSVFNDVDGDAFQDAAESGMGSVAVELFRDINGNGKFDATDELLQSVVTTTAGFYQFAGLDAGEYLVRTVSSSLPANFLLTTGFGTRAITLGLCGGIAADFGYQGVIQFVTPLGAYRSDIPDSVVVPFVRPASDPIGDLLRDPERTLETFLPFYAPYQSVSISNPSDSAMTVTGLEAVIESANIGTERFVTVFTAAQLERLMEIESELDGHFADGQPVPGSLRAELDELLRGVTDPAQIQAIPAGGSLELLAIYRPIEVAATSSGENITSQLPNWSSNATAEEGRSHTFDRSDRLEISTSGGQTIQFQLVGGSTFDGDVFNHNGLVDVDDIALINAIILGDWPANPGEPAWDPTTDANTRFPNGAGAAGGPAWPDVLRATTPVLKEIGFGDLGILNVEFPRNSRAPFLDLHGSPGARGVDYTADVSPEEISTGVAITDAARFANAANLELSSLRVVLTNAFDGADEVLTVDTGDTGIVVAENTLANGQRTLVLSHEGGIPATVSSYQQVLNTLRYANQSAAPTAGVRVVAVQAIGTLGDFSFTKNGATVDQTQGNIAVARLNVSSGA